MTLTNKLLNTSFIIPNLKKAYMYQPFVSCITPTANREKFLPLAIGYFLSQDYKNAEMIIIDDGKYSLKDTIPTHDRIKYYYFPEKIGTIGTKRNLACEKSVGEIIIHWDDDDYYAPDWISRQVDAHYNSGADITGLNTVHFYSPTVDRKWTYQDLDLEKPWLCGATMAYKKTLWEGHQFIDLQVGEDYDFVWNAGGKIFALDYSDGFFSILHAHNTSLKPIENPRHKKHSEPWTAGIDAFDNK
jgi:glycosyltransferase involved in cell wall biosynthesis